MEIIANILTDYWQIITLFFLASILYSSAGFGGGSSYLAILTLFALPFAEIRVISLVCNIVVVSSNVFLFSKQKLYDWKKLLPLVIISVPAAYLGGKLLIEKDFFFVVLSITLITAALVMLFGKKINSKPSVKTKTSLLKNTGIGGVIGFISGLVGIGGGIFLAPFLHLSNWDSAKRIAAVSSLFILVNSIAGLLGQSQNENFSINTNLTIALACTVFVGGQIGSRLSIKFISPTQLKRITAVVILIAATNILVKHLL